MPAHRFNKQRLPSPAELPTLWSSTVPSTKDQSPIRRRPATFCVQRVDGPGVSELDQPYGLLTPPAQQEAFLAKLYMHKYGGATSADFGQISVLSRKHAANNPPKAWFYERPITIEDHQNSRMIADPIRLLDCCQESDGGQALVIVSAERARDLPHKPAVISGAAQGVGPQQISMSSYYRDDIDSMPEVELVARQLWDQAGIGPDDIDAAILYDAFTPPMVLLQLEEYGFCGRGEAKDFISDAISSWTVACRSTPTAVNSVRDTSTASTVLPKVFA